MHAGFDDMKGTSETDAIWKKQLLNLKGDQWKTVRAKFSPIFTAGKLKTMMGFVDAVCNEMSKEVEPASENNQVRAVYKTLEEVLTSIDRPYLKDIDLKTLCGKFSMETIASCAFGLSAGSFACDTETEFITNAKATFSMKPADGIRMLSYMIPGIRQAIDTLRISIVKPTETRFFVSLIKAAVRERRSSGRRRNDMIDLMIDAIENEQKTELDEDTVVATAMVLLIAGYDTTALTMSYCLWRLALNPEVQARVQQEIDEMVAKEAIHGEQMLDYSSLQNLEYLEQVLNETLRLHPPFGAHTRRCTRDYVLPGTEVTIRKGDEVQIPAVGIHFDERYFPNAETFDPDRFSKEAQVVRHSMAFMPFGHGPRICIGMRFALLESKAAIANILRKYDIVAGPNTPTKVSLAPGSVSARADKTLWVKARRRQRT